MPNELPISNDRPIRTSTPVIVRGNPFSNALGLSIRQLGVAVGIAAASDVIAAFLTPLPPLMWAVDVATAISLFIVLGWRWPLLVGLILEAIPGVGVVPFWLLVVAAIALWGSPRPKLKSRT